MPGQESYPYLPHTDQERKAMLKEIGVATFDELLKHIPEELRVKELKLPQGLSEMELIEHIEALAGANRPADSNCFAGGGAYNRFVPAVVPTVVSRSEFATAYTPYQPEVSQGSLQAIYEFQTAICLLTGMDVANASMYDGPTACAEAALMSCRITRREKILVSGAVNPEYRMVTKTYVESCGLSWAEADGTSGITGSIDDLDEETACLILQYPNYFGIIEDLQSYAEKAHAKGALLVVITDPVSLGLLTPPGDLAADIVIGDGQSCGNSLTFGGPSVGYMSTKQKYVRQLPGRLAGITKDNRGQRAFTLTLQTREQHIRRAKATSNICTNQALNALAMLVYLSLMGPAGLRQVAEISVRRAHYLAEKLCLLPGVELAFDKPFFNEFVIKTALPAKEVLSGLRENEILGGLNLGTFFESRRNEILIAVTEMNKPESLEKYIQAMKEIMPAETNNPKPVEAGKSV